MLAVTKRPILLNKRRRERRMKKRLNVESWLPQDIEMSTKTCSPLFTTTVSFIMEDWLLTRTSKLLTPPSSQLVVFVNSPEDTRLSVREDPWEWIDIMEERWDLDWPEVSLTSTTPMPNKKVWKRSYQASTCHKAKVVFFQEISCSTTSRPPTHWFLTQLKRKLKTELL